jgi:cell division transport system ATP-binding protein
MSTSPDGAIPEELRASSQPAVRFDAVWLKRAGETPLLRGVSFALAPGSLHVVLGGPGSGKTALLRLICLAESPTQGLAQVFGRDVLALDRRERVSMRRRIGAALEPAVFIDHLSVWDNAALGPRVTGRKRGEYQGQVDEVLAWMGLAKQSDALPGQLAAAERQRLALARAVVGAPEILLVDEPAGGPADRAWLLKRLDEFRQTGAAVLLATSDPSIASGHPTLRLQDGKVSVTDPEPLQ